MTLLNLLFRPFRLVAGLKSVILSVVITVATLLVSVLSKTHFPDLISVKLYPDVTFLLVSLQLIVNWFLPFILLYVIALIAGKPAGRLIDFIGTIGMARFPYLLAALLTFVPAISEVSSYLLNGIKGVEITHIPSTLSWIFFSIVSVLSLLMLVWYFILLFNAYRTCSGMSNSRLIITFSIGVVLALILSFPIHRYVYLLCS